MAAPSPLPLNSFYSALVAQAPGPGQLMTDSVTDGIDMLDDHIPDFDQSAKGIPSRADWDRHRPTITQLYSTQGLPLKQVMQYMEKEYHLFATENMYKKRIKIWGLDKKFKRHEAIIMLALKYHHKSAGQSVSFTLRDKEISILDLERYARRARITFREISGIKLDQIAHLAPTLIVQRQLPVPLKLSSPDNLDRVERVVHATLTYLKGGLDQSVWYTDANGFIGWQYTELRNTALEVIVLQFDIGCNCYWNGEMQRAVTAWRMAFLHTEQFVKQPDPEVWLECLRLRKRWFESIPSDVMVAWTRHVQALIDSPLVQGCAHSLFAKTIWRLETADANVVQDLCSQVIFDFLETVPNPEAWSRERALFIARHKNLKVSSMPSASELINTLEVRVVYEEVDLMLVQLLRVASENQWTPPGGEISVELRVAYLRILATTGSPEEAESFKVDIIGHFADVYYTCEKYSLAKDNFEAFFRAAEAYSDVYGGTCIEEWELYECYEAMHYICNSSDIADGDQQWRLKMEAMEKAWEDELNEKVGELSLEVGVYC